MKTVLVAVALSLGVTAQAAAKPRYKIQIQPADGQTEYWQNGFQYVDDKKPTSTVRVISIQDDLPDKQSTFRVLVLNKSQRSFIFGPEDITIEYSGDKRLEMATYEELTGRLRRDIKRRRAVALFGKVLSVASADGRTTGDFDYSGMNAYGATFHGSGSYTAYNPALALRQQEAALDRAEQAGRAIEARQMTGAQALSGLIRKSTVLRGGTGGGIVAYDAPPSFARLANSATATIVVRVEGEEHRMPVKISEVK